MNSLARMLNMIRSEGAAGGYSNPDCRDYERDMEKLRESTDYGEGQRYVSTDDTPKPYPLQLVRDSQGRVVWELVRETLKEGSYGKINFREF